MSLTQIDWGVWERRYRGIYELMDSGKNKKAISELDKLLTKHPHFNWAKALKALALSRLGKTEEARSALIPVMAEVPAEEGTVLVLSLCLVELNELDKLVTYLEAAYKKQPSEKLLVQRFMCQVRVQQFQKQHLTALTLYKTYKRPIYFGLAIVSLHLKVEMSPRQNEDENRRITLPLAERMLLKYITEQEISVEDDFLKLFYYNLSLQGKWRELQIALESQRGLPLRHWANDDSHQYYCSALHNLGKTMELFEYLKFAYSKNDTEIELLKQIVDLIGPTSPDLVDRYLRKLSCDCRNPYAALADLLFIKRFKKNTSSSAVVDRFGSDVLTTWKYWAANTSLYSTLRECLILCEDKWILGDLNPHFQLYDDRVSLIKYNSVAKLIEDINFELIERQQNPDNSPIKIMARVHRCIEKYFRSDAAFPSASNESRYQDQFLLLAASSLLRPFTNEDPHLQGVVAKVRDSKPNWVSSSVPEDNERLTGDSSTANATVLSDQDYFMMTAITLMEFGLNANPQNHSLRILLSEAYSRVGAMQRAAQVVTELELKYVQWESLGYLILPRVLQGGLYSDARKLFTAAEKMYASFKRESMEFVIEAYHNASYGQVMEFMKFREVLLNSLQLGMVHCEKGFLEFLTNVGSAESLRKVAENIEKDFRSEEILRREEPFYDNRDLTVLHSLVEDGNTDGMKSVSFKTGLKLFKIRRSILESMTYLVLCLEEDGPGPEGDRVKRFCAAFDKLPLALANILDERDAINEKKFPCGLWPSVLARYREIMPSIIEQFMLAREVIHDETEVSDAISRTTELIIDDMDQFRSSVMEKLGQGNLIDVGIAIVELHIILDAMSTSRVVFFALLHLLKLKGTGEPNSEWKCRSATASGYTCITKATKTLLNLIKVVNESVNKLGPSSWENAADHWEDVIGARMRDQIFPQLFDKVQMAIWKSYFSQLEEMCGAVEKLLEFWKDVEGEFTSCAGF